MTVTGVDDAVLVARIRDQAATIAAEMTAAIQAGIPEYARPADARYPRVIRMAVDASLNHFLDLLQQRDSGRPEWRELFRAIGAGEQREGRSLDALQAATRLGARLGWRWLVDFAQAEGLPLPVLGRLAELLFGYLDQVANASAAGYAQAQAAEAGELDRRRRRLLELLLAEPAVPVETLATAAQAARWPLPARLAAVAVPATLSHTPLLPPDVVAKTAAKYQEALTAGLRGVPAAVGVPVPPADAASSLRWARQALDLAERGLLPGEPVWCTEHLATLALFRDERLLAVLVGRRLAPLAGLRAGPRRLLTDTLLAWLQLDRNATDVAARLHVHPQTVRYRLRQLDTLFGPALRDPAQRLELEVALLAERAVGTR